MTADALLTAICHCDVVVERLAEPEARHPCRAIVQAQGSDPQRLAAREVCEPWSGPIATAPLVAVVGSPHLHGTDLRPRWTSSDQFTADFFAGRLDGGPARRSSSGRRASAVCGSRSPVASHRPIPSWRGPSPAPTSCSVGRRVSPTSSRSPTRSGARPTVTPGSRGAWKACADRWLRDVLERTTAPVLLALGAVADKALGRVLGLFAGGGARVTEVTVAGTSRLVAVLPHPDAPGGARPVDELLAAHDLAALRERLGVAPALESV